MRKILIVFCAIFSFISVSAQNTDAMLFGDVKSKETGEHLPYTRIQVKGTNLITACDGTGHFRLAHLPLGKQTIVASLVGFKSQEIVVEMKKGKGTEVYFELEDDEQELNQVVVTGTRTQHFVKNVPIRTEVVTSKAISNKNAINLYEALSGVAGIRVEEQCQFCSFSEVRMQGLGTEHTQVLIDGAPTYSGLAGVYGLQQVGTNDIDRLEVVKGAGSALYGSSAVAGAINIITKEPTFEPSLKLDMQFGNFGNKNLNASASIRKNNIGLNFFAQRSEAGVIDETKDGNTRNEVKGKDGISDRVETKLTNLGFGVYVFNPFTDNDKLVFRGKVIDESRAGGVLTNDAYKNPFTFGTENIKTNRISADVAYKLPIGNKSELNFTNAYVHHYRNATNDTFLGDYAELHDGQKPDVESMRPYIAKENTFTPSLTFTTSLGNHTLIAGVQGYFTNLEETGLYCINDKEDPLKGTAYTSISKKHANEYGFFLQDEWAIMPNLTIVPGLRFDSHNSGEEYLASEKVYEGRFPKTKFNETSFNPRLAVKYEVTKKLVLRANVGTGFRAPYGFSEDLHLCSGSPRVWKSSDLKGERSMSYNISADYYGKNILLSANIFRTDLKNKIQFSDASDEVKKLGYTYEWQNVDDAYVQGIELGVKWTPIRNFKTGVNWTFNQGKFKNIRADWAETEYAQESKNISRFPTMTGDIMLEYTPNTWTFVLSSSLQGKMYIDYMGENLQKIKKTDTYMLFNLHASKRLGDFTIYAGGKNIFSYVQNEKHTDDAAFMYAPMYGATWYAGVSLSL